MPARYELNQLVRENDEKSDVTYTYEYVNGNIKYKHQYAYTTGTLPETPQKTTEYHYEDDVWCDVLTKITETTYSGTNTSTASTYSFVGGGVLDAPSNATNPLADFLFGDNCNTVDLTENAVINVGAIHESPARASTYSLNSNSTEIATIQSDTIGNITNIGDATLTWNGRRLESIGQGGIELVTYDYNMDGQRVKKNVTDPTTNTTVTTEYFYNGDILAGQKKGNDVLIFMYDNNGDAFGFTYNGTPYYYVKNAQNDVVFIVDETNHIVVYYEYDAWGKVIYCNDTSGFGLAGINPLMYRSYYVDLETGLFVYYLNSRYYIADWGRFASADSYVQTGQGMLDKNMFAYCMNNPVNRIDTNGENSETLQWWTATMGWLCLIDTALPVGDIVYLGGMVLLAIGCAITATEVMTQPTIAIPKVEEKEAEKDVVIDIPKTPDEPVYIYRYNGASPENLTPSQRDVDLYPKTGKGLSFSTTPRPGSAVTTIEALNATGVVYAIQDGANHVSVFPIGGTLEDWYNAGPSSHWTTAVESVVISWDGGG